MHPTNEQRKLVRVMMLIIVLAAATHLCSSQMAHGQQASSERFLRAPRGADVELRGEATVVGAEIRFRQIARWGDSDKPVFEPIGDLIVTRFAAGEAFRRIELREVKTLLIDAGVNVAPMNFSGAIACTITRSDAQLPEGTALQQWERAQTPAPMPSRAVAATLPPTPADARTSEVKFQNEHTSSTRTLRDALSENLAEKLGLPLESMQISFRPQDEKLLRLAEPQFRFGIEPQRMGNLGNVSWNVTIVSDKGSSRVFLPAEAKAWQDQLVVARPMSTKQVITETDVAERRVLVDRLLDDALLNRPQVVGQMAGRELKPGMVMTANLVDAVQLVRTGQFVTIETVTGGVKLKIVGKALDPGTLGQIVRVRNEATREILQATVTGPQTASLAG